MAFSLACKRFIRSHPAQRVFPRLYSNVCPGKKGLVLGVYQEEDCEGLELTPTAEKFNQNTQGKLTKHLELAGNKIRPGKSYVFWGLNDEFPTVAVVGLGKKAKTYDDIELICDNKESVRIAASAGCKALDGVGIKNISVEALGDAESAAEGSILSMWKFQEYKSKKEELPKVLFHKSESCNDTDQWCKGVIKANAQNIARRLADTPGNLMTPTLFAENAKEILKASPDICIEIRDQKWLESENMNAILAVAKGSCEPPKFLEITYEKSKSSPVFVLVGKGVTFDAGGISLKPPGSMDEMRADMSGAACVLATCYALSQLKLNVNVNVLIPLVENLPSGSAIKPGDVIKARNGKTICVDNTDAEGRLVLADALAYSSVFKPKWVLDIATLTGAMRVALGGAATGVFSNSNQLYELLQRSGSISGDRMWRFPLWKYYTKQIAENAAYDLNNIGKGKGGGSCTAAAFLKEFVPDKTNWLHLDIASVMGPTDDTPYLTKGMTGRPTRTLIEFIEAQSC